MEKILEDNEHNVCFFSCITAIGEKKKVKPRKRRRNEDDDEEECSNFNCGVFFWIVFNWPEYEICHLKNIYPDNFWQWSLIVLQSHTGKKKTENSLFNYCKYRNVWSMFYNNTFAVHSSDFFFLKKNEGTQTNHH